MSASTRDSDLARVGDALTQACARTGDLAADLDFARTRTRELASDGGGDGDVARALASAGRALVSAGLALARAGLALARAHAYTHTSDLAADLDFARTRIRNADPDFARASARGLTRGLTRAVTAALPLALFQVVAVTRGFATGLADARTSKRGLADLRGFARCLVHGVADALNRAPGRSGTGELTSLLAVAYASTDALVRLAFTSGSALWSRDGAKDREQAGAGPVTPSASRLVGAAARLLPAPDRARYAEEYRSELWETAQAGAGRWRQLQYAVRQLTHALLLHSALRVPRRKSTAP